MTSASVSLSINGAMHSVETTADTAVDLIRDDLGLTGTKMACGGGQCGSCVILVNGVAVASCLLPVGDLEGAEVTTIEGLGGQELHPIQRAFIVADAVQCGFCTPGFLVEAALFCDRWRAEHGDVEPQDDDVERALAGHLCRCGAYRSILTAVKEACAGQHDRPGVPVGRPDALDKVTGAARYTVDVKLSGMVHGVIVRSRQAHADVVDVDIAAAINVDGFLGYLDLLDGVDRVRYVGQPIGALAALTKRAAQRAAALVEVTYRPLGSVTTIKDALADDAPQVHGPGWRPPSASEGPALPNLRKGNRRGPTPVGSTRPLLVARRLRSARATDDPLLVEGVWRTQPQAHTALEPHACVAEWVDGSPVVHLSTQAVSVTADELERHLELESGSVTVIAEHIGGAFGAKQGLTEEALAAVSLSRRIGLPVSIVYDRQEELSVGGYRPAVESELAALGSADRSLIALSISSHVNGGTAAGVLAASWARVMYPGVPRTLLDFDVLTNRPPGKPFRAPGAPSVAWALEQAVDEIADRLGTDPISLRRGWSPSPAQVQLYDWVESLDVWSKRTRVAEGRLRTGVGVAFASWFYGFDRETSVSVSVSDGRIMVASGSQDMGNGTRVVLRDAVAQRLGVSPDLVQVEVGDSRLSWGPTSSGSRTTASVWPTAVEAAGGLAERMRDAAGGIGFDGAEPGDGGIIHAGELVSWGDLLSRLPPIRVVSKRPADDHRPFLPVPIAGLTVGWGITHGSHVVEVAVDTETGRVTPLWVGAGLAVGNIHSHRQAVSQVEGGVIQGLSYALHEEWVVDRDTGAVISSDLDAYRLIGMADSPVIDVHFLPGGFDHVPGGGVGLSELATLGVAAATGNAVAAATGQRIRELPIRPGPRIAP